MSGGGAPFDLFVSRVDGFQPVTSLNSDVVRAGRAYCPSCDQIKHDNKRRLEIVESAHDSALLLMCRRDCSVIDIMKAVGLQASDLYSKIDRLAAPKNNSIAHWQSVISAADSAEESGFMLSMSSSVDELHLRQIALEQSLKNLKIVVRAAMRADATRGAK